MIAEDSFKSLQVPSVGLHNGARPTRTSNGSDHAPAGYQQNSGVSVLPKYQVEPLEGSPDVTPTIASVSRDGSLTFQAAKRSWTPPRPDGSAAAPAVHTVPGSTAHAHAESAHTVDIAAHTHAPASIPSPQSLGMAAVAQGKGSQRDVNSALARWRLQRSRTEQAHAQAPDTQPASVRLPSPGMSHSRVQGVLFTPTHKRLLQQHTKTAGAANFSDEGMNGTGSAGGGVSRSSWGLTAARITNGRQGEDDAGEAQAGQILAQHALRLNPSVYSVHSDRGMKATAGWTVPRGSAWQPFLQAAAAGGSGHAPSGKHIAHDVLCTAAVLKSALLLGASAEFAVARAEHGERHAGRVTGAALLHFWSNACALLVRAVDCAADPMGQLPPRGPAAVHAALDAVGLGASAEEGAGDAHAADAVAGYVAQLWLQGVTPVADVAVVAAAGVQLPQEEGGESSSPRSKPYLQACRRLHTVTSTILTCMGQQLFRALPSGPRLAWFVQGAGLRSSPEQVAAGGYRESVRPSGQQGSAQHAVLAVLSRMSRVLLHAQCTRAAPLRSLAGGRNSQSRHAAPASGVDAALLTLPLHELRIRHLDEDIVEGSMLALDALMAGAAPADMPAACGPGPYGPALMHDEEEAIHAERLPSLQSVGGMSQFTDRGSVAGDAPAAPPRAASKSRLPQPKRGANQSGTHGAPQLGGTVSERGRSSRAARRDSLAALAGTSRGRRQRPERDERGQPPAARPPLSRRAPRVHSGEGDVIDDISPPPSNRQLPPTAQAHPRGEGITRSAGIAPGTPVRAARGAAGPSTPLEDPEATPPDAALHGGGRWHPTGGSRGRLHAADAPGVDSSLPPSALLLLWSSACRWWVQGQAVGAHPLDSALVRSDDTLRSGLDVLLGDPRVSAVAAATRSMLLGGDILHPGLPLCVTPLGWRLVTSMLAVTLKYKHTSVVASCFKRWAGGAGCRRGDAAAAGAIVAQRSRSRHLAPWLRRWLLLSRAVTFARRSAKQRMFHHWSTAAAQSRAQDAAEEYGADVWRVRAMTSALGAWRQRCKVARRERFLTNMARGHANTAVQRRVFTVWAGWAPVHRRARDVAKGAAWHMTVWGAKRTIRSWHAAAHKSSGTNLLLSVAPYLQASMAVRQWKHRVDTRKALQRLAANVQPIAAARLAQRHLWAWAGHIQHLKRTSAAVDHHASSLLSRGLQGLRAFVATSRANKQHSLRLRSVLARLLLRPALAKWAENAKDVRLAAAADAQYSKRLQTMGIAGLKYHKAQVQAERALDMQAVTHHTRAAKAAMVWHWAQVTRRHAKQRNAEAFAKLVLRARCWTALRRNMQHARQRREKRRLAVQHATLQRMRNAFKSWRRLHDVVQLQHTAEEAATSYSRLVLSKKVFRGWAGLAAQGSRRRNAAEAAYLSRIITWTAACFDAWRERTHAVMLVRVANEKRAAARAVRGWLAATIQRRMRRDATEVAVAHCDFTRMQRVWRVWHTHLADAKAEAELGHTMAAWHLRRVASRALHGWRRAAQASRAERSMSPDAASIDADSLEEYRPQLAPGPLPVRHLDRPLLGRSAEMLGELSSAHQAAQLHSQAAQLMQASRGWHQRDASAHRTHEAVRAPAGPVRPRSVSPVDSMNGDLAQLDALIQQQHQQLQADMGAVKVAPPPERPLAAAAPRQSWGGAQPDPPRDMQLPPPSAQSESGAPIRSAPPSYEALAFVAAHLQPVEAPGTAGREGGAGGPPASPLPPSGSPRAPLTVHKPSTSQDHDALAHSPVLSVCSGGGGVSAHSAERQWAAAYSSSEAYSDGSFTHVRRAGVQQRLQSMGREGDEAGGMVGGYEMYS